MSSVRSLVARLRRIEHDRMNRVLAKLGGPEGWAAFEAEATAGMAEGRYDRRDVPVVIASIRSWLAS